VGVQILTWMQVVLPGVISTKHKSK
jgi:hypothetical protein